MSTATTAPVRTGYTCGECGTPAEIRGGRVTVPHYSWCRMLRVRELIAAMKGIRS